MSQQQVFDKVLGVCCCVLYLSGMLMKPNEVLIQPELLAAGHLTTTWGQAALRLQRSTPIGSLSMTQTRQHLSSFQPSRERGFISSTPLRWCNYQILEDIPLPNRICELLVMRWSTGVMRLQCHWRICIIFGVNSSFMSVAFIWKRFADLWKSTQETNQSTTSDKWLLPWSRPQDSFSNLLRLVN